MDPDVINRFLTLYQPTDEESRIDAWSKYESIYPKTFFGMYKFWVKNKLETIYIIDFVFIKFFPIKGSA